MEHAALLVEQLDALSEPRDHHVTRQYILKVKDIQRKLDASAARFQTWSPPRDTTPEAALLMRCALFPRGASFRTIVKDELLVDSQNGKISSCRQRIQEASQRLVVYRASRDGKPPRRLDPGLLSPNGAFDPDSFDSLDTNVPQTKPQAARSLFANSEPNLSVKISASTMPLPSIPTVASDSLTRAAVSSSSSDSQISGSSTLSHESLGSESRTSNLFRPPVGNAPFRELSNWKSEPQIQHSGADGSLSVGGDAKESHAQKAHSTSFLNSFVSGRPAQNKPPTTGSAFVPIVPHSNKLTNSKGIPSKVGVQHTQNVRTMTSRNTGIHIHSALPPLAIPDAQKESGVDSDRSPAADPFNDPDKTPTPSPPPTRSYKRLSGAISEVRRNIDEISKSCELPDENRETPLLPAVEDSSSIHSRDTEPRVQNSNLDLDESLGTKGGTLTDKQDMDFKRDFANEDIRTSSPLSATDEHAPSVGRLTKENLRRNETLYWSTQKHDFTDNSFLENENVAKNGELSESEFPVFSISQNQSAPSPQRENIFADFVPAMPDRPRERHDVPLPVQVRRGNLTTHLKHSVFGSLESAVRVQVHAHIPLQVNLNLRAGAYQQRLLGELEAPRRPAPIPGADSTLFPGTDPQFPDEDDEDFDPYALEPYHGGTGLYFDHSLSTIEEVSVVSESTKADEETGDKDGNLQVKMGQLSVSPQTFCFHEAHNSYFETDKMKLIGGDFRLVQ